MEMFAENQKVTRKELTNLLCKEELSSGLIPQGGMMQVSIIDGRFSVFTDKKYAIKWRDKYCKEGIVISIPEYQGRLNRLGTQDTSEYNEL